MRTHPTQMCAYNTQLCPQRLLMVVPQEIWGPIHGLTSYIVSCIPNRPLPRTNELWHHYPRKLFSWFNSHNFFLTLSFLTIAFILYFLFLHWCIYFTIFFFHFYHVFEKLGYYSIQEGDSSKKCYTFELWFFNLLKLILN